MRCGTARFVMSNRPENTIVDRWPDPPDPPESSLEVGELQFERIRSAPARPNETEFRSVII